MAHPRLTEEAADAITRRLAAFDDRLMARALRGQQMPDPAAMLDEIERLVMVAHRAAFDDIAPLDDNDLESSGLLFAVFATMEQITAYVNRAVRDHEQIAAEVVRDRATIEDTDADTTELTPTALARAGSVGLALLTIARRQRRIPNRAQVGRITRLARTRPPRQSAGRSRVAVRTEAAIARNEYAADIADRADARVVLLIEDARLGPTDEPCHDVDGRYATSTWLRNHPVEHPNCTRRGRPRRLPDGARVTLLR